MEEPFIISLGLYGFLIAYTIYMFFTYKIDPRFSLDCEKPPSFQRLLWLSVIEKSVLFLLLTAFAIVPQRDLYVIFSFDKIFSVAFAFSLGLGVLSGVLIFFGGMPVNFLILAVRRKFSINKTKREAALAQLLATSVSKPPAHLFFNVVAASVIASTLEEIIFRGYLLGHLTALTVPAVAIVVQAVFAFVPQLYQGMYNAFLSLYGGILFGVVFVWSGSLLTCIVAHITQDVVGFVFTLSSAKRRKNG